MFLRSCYFNEKKKKSLIFTLLKSILRIFWRIFFNITLKKVKQASVTWNFSYEIRNWFPMENYPPTSQHYRFFHDSALGIAS